jgi:hypothetical protein
MNIHNSLLSDVLGTQQTKLSVTKLRRTDKVIGKSALCGARRNGSIDANYTRCCARFYDQAGGGFGWSENCTRVHDEITREESGSFTIRTSWAQGPHRVAFKFKPDSGVSRKC